MNELLTTITKALDGGTVRQLGEQIGADPTQTQEAVLSALPMLLGMLGHNASRPEGAADLAEAVRKDHSGGLLDQLGSYLSQGDVREGEGILGHVLGRRQEPAEQALAGRTGLSGSQAHKLLALLAPIVLAAIGRMSQGERSGQGGSDLIGSLLQGAMRELGGGSSSSADPLGSLLGGQSSDLLSTGKALLGNLLKR